MPPQRFYWSISYWADIFLWGKGNQTLSAEQWNMSLWDLSSSQASSLPNQIFLNPLSSLEYIRNNPNKTANKDSIRPLQSLVSDPGSVPSPRHFCCGRILHPRLVKIFTRIKKSGHTATKGHHPVSWWFLWLRSLHSWGTRWQPASCPVLSLKGMSRGWVWVHWVQVCV